MDKKTRVYEELISLQDKAIEALTQANAALVMALEALKKARAEHGTAIPLPGLGNLTVPNSPFQPYVPNVPITVPYWGDGNGTLVANGGDSGDGNGTLVANGGDSQKAVSPKWSLGSTAGLQCKTVTAQSLVSKAATQKDLALEYLNVVQKQLNELKESDAVQTIGGCVSPG